MQCSGCQLQPSCVYIQPYTAAQLSIVIGIKTGMILNLVLNLVYTKFVPTTSRYTICIQLCVHTRPNRPPCRGGGGFREFN